MGTSYLNNTHNEESVGIFKDNWERKDISKNEFRINAFRTGKNRYEVICPYCNNIHNHGYGEGYRQPDCSLGKDYYIIIESDRKKINEYKRQKIEREQAEKINDIVELKFGISKNHKKMDELKKIFVKEYKDIPLEEFNIKLKKAEEKELGFYLDKTMKDIIWLDEKESEKEIEQLSKETSLSIDSLNEKFIDYKKKEFGLKYCFKPLTLSDIKKINDDKSQEIFPGVYKGDKILTYGDSNSYKTLYCIYRGLCVACSDRKVKYLDTYRLKPHQIGVLFMSAEDSPLKNKMKIIPLLRGMKIRRLKDIPFRIIKRKDCGDLSEQEYLDYICNIIYTNDIKWVILDTGVLFFPDYDDNLSREVNLIYSRFINHISDKGVVVELIAHTDKMKKNFLGSTKWKGNSDVLYRIEREGLNQEFEVFNEKNKNIETETQRIKVDIEYYDEHKRRIKSTRLSLINTSEPRVFRKSRKESKKSNFVTDVIIDIFKKNQNKPLHQNKILDILLQDGKIKVGKSTIYATIRKTLKDGILIENKGGLLLNDAENDNL